MVIYYNHYYCTDIGREGPLKTQNQADQLFLSTMCRRFAFPLEFLRALLSCDPSLCWRSVTIQLNPTNENILSVTYIYL